MVTHHQHGGKRSLIARYPQTSFKLTSSHVSAIAATILVLFTMINFYVMSMTSCCDRAEQRRSNINSDCSQSSSTISSLPSSRRMAGKTDSNPRPEEHNLSTTSSSGTLESTLLFLYDSIQPPHWKDSDTGEQHLNMKTITNAYHRSIYVDKEDITLVTHGSIEKFSQLLDQISRWHGPISFVMYLNSHSDIKEFCRNMKEKVTPEFLEYVSIHVLLEKHGGSLPYPNNVLRNIAQRNIESNYFLLMDVDFIPSPGMYQYLKTSLDLERIADALPGSDFFWTKLRNNTVFVIPAFERFAPDDSSVVTLDMVPSTKSELLQLLEQKEAATFHAYFPPGHYPTNYDKWYETNTQNEFSYPIEYMKRFEPYVVAYKRGIPDFWDGFRGFGFNAATWFWELNLAGYRFETIRDHFLVHLNHPGRKGRNITDGSIPKLQLRRFMRYISRKYGVDQMALRVWKGRKYGNGTHVSLVCETCK